jgi:hypothetical protein
VVDADRCHARDGDDKGLTGGKARAAKMTVEQQLDATQPSASDTPGQVPRPAPAPASASSEASRDPARGRGGARHPSS